MNPMKLSRLPATLAFATLAVFVHPTFSAPGDLDPTFGGGTGKVITDLGGRNYFCTSVAFQSDGKIVAAGTAQFDGTKSDFALVRYNANGSLDTSFNGTGFVLTDFGPGDNGRSIVVQGDGKIVVAGNSDGIGFALARYNPNGSLDASFNGTGKVTTDGGDVGRGVALQSDGKIVAAGDSSSGSLVMRFNSDGSLDTSFNGTGKVTTPNSGGNSVGVQSDGKIVIAGVASGAVTVVRYNINGSLDTAFNGIGKVTTPFGIGVSEFTAALQDDGKIVAAGTVQDVGNTSFGVVRYNADGSLDASFNGTGMVTSYLGARRGYCNSVALQNDHKIVVAGFSYVPPTVGPQDDFVVMRYNPDGSLDTTFNGTGIVSTDVSGGQDQGYSIAVQTDGKIVVGGLSPQIPPSGSSGFAIVRYQALSPGPEIAVEQPPGINRVDGVATVSFGGILPGATASRTFAIQNYGDADLTGVGLSLDGPAAADFAVTVEAAPRIAGGGSTTFTIRFAPTSIGLKNAALHIASNDADENPFDIALTGRGIVAEGDDDGDGVSNQAEMNLAAYGFDPLVDNTALITTLRNNGLFRASDMQTLALGSPLLEKNAATGHFHLSLGMEKSPNLGTWTPLTGFTPTYDAQTGRIEIDFTPDTSNAQFYRVLGAKP